MVETAKKTAAKWAKARVTFAVEDTFSDSKSTLKLQRKMSIHFHTFLP